jgi:hypothetical protein
MTAPAWRRWGFVGACLLLVGCAPNAMPALFAGPDDDAGWAIEDVPRAGSIYTAGEFGRSPPEPGYEVEAAGASRRGGRPVAAELRGRPRREELAVELEPEGEADATGEGDRLAAAGTTEEMGESVFGVDSPFTYSLGARQVSFEDLVVTSEPGPPELGMPGEEPEASEGAGNEASSATPRRRASESILASVAATEPEPEGADEEKRGERAKPAGGPDLQGEASATGAASRVARSLDRLAEGVNSDASPRGASAPAAPVKPEPAVSSPAAVASEGTEPGRATSQPEPSKQAATTRSASTGSESGSRSSAWLRPASAPATSRPAGDRWKAARSPAASTETAADAAANRAPVESGAAARTWSASRR